LLVPVRVCLGRGKPGLVGTSNNQLRLRITAAPVDGKANDQARKLLAKAFGVAAGSVELVRGTSSRDKLFSIMSPVRLPAELLG